MYHRVGRRGPWGAEIGIGHTADNLKDVDVVVISSAVYDDNPEVVEAKRLHVPVIPRPGDG